MTAVIHIHLSTSSVILRKWGYDFVAHAFAVKQKQIPERLNHPSKAPALPGTPLKRRVAYPF